MRGAKKEYSERFNKRNKEELNKLESKVRRKRELYEKADAENRWYLDKGDLGKMVYDSNTKFSKNAYIKAEAELMAFKKKGSDYVDRKMKQEFGRDYADWNKEVETRNAVILGTAAAATLLAYGGAVYKYG